jgi:hypothetical protein
MKRKKYVRYDDIIDWIKSGRTKYNPHIDWVKQEGVERMIGETEQDDDKLYLVSTKDLVKMFNVSEKTISKWVSGENFPVYSNEPRNRLYDMTAVLKWVYNKTAFIVGGFVAYQDYNDDDVKYSGDGVLYFDAKNEKYYGATYKVWNEAKRKCDEITSDLAEFDRDRLCYHNIF